VSGYTGEPCSLSSGRREAPDRGNPRAGSGRPKGLRSRAPVSVQRSANDPAAREPQHSRFHLRRTCSRLAKISGLMMAFPFRARSFFAAILLVQAMLAAPQVGAAPGPRQTGTAMWDLSDLYQSSDTWSAEYDRVRAEVQGLQSYRGTLGA